MGVMTGANTAGADREVATQALNAELQDKGFLLTSTEWTSCVTRGIKFQIEPGAFFRQLGEARLKVVCQREDIIILRLHPFWHRTCKTLKVHLLMKQPGVSSRHSGRRAPCRR